MKIVLLESLGIPSEVLQEYIGKLEEKGHAVAVFERTADKERLIAQCRDADVAILANMPFPDEVIRACPKLKFIDVAFTGVDHVGLDAAKENHVAVSNASGYSNEAVSELVLEMALSLSRNVSQVEARCREGGTKDGLVGREIKGKTVGIVGMGAIGSRVAEIFHLLGCRVIAHTPHPKADAPSYMTFLTLAEVMEQADIVTLHCPLNASTRNLINEEMIGRMKPDAILINAARGPVVDQEALAKALKSGAIAGAGIDVFETEPPIAADHPLLTAPNTVLTPHVAFATRESMLLRAKIVFESLDQWLAGNQINKIL